MLRMVKGALVAISLFGISAAALAQPYRPDDRGPPPRHHHHHHYYRHHDGYPHD